MDVWSAVAQFVEHGLGFKGFLVQDFHQSHSVVSLGMALYLFLSNGSTQEDRKSSQHD